MTKTIIEIDHVIARATLRGPAEDHEVGDALREYVSAPCPKNERALGRFGIRVVKDAR